jgi:hypothetical protein
MFSRKFNIFKNKLAGIEKKFLGGVTKMWRQGFGEWLFPLQSPFSTVGLPAALEVAVTGGSTEESSTLILL